MTHSQLKRTLLPDDSQLLSALLDINHVLTTVPTFRGAVRRALEILERHGGIVRSALTLPMDDDSPLHVESHATRPTGSLIFRHCCGRGVPACRKVVALRSRLRALRGQFRDFRRFQAPSSRSSRCVWALLLLQPAHSSANSQVRTITY